MWGLGCMVWGEDWGEIRGTGYILSGGRVLGFSVMNGIGGGILKKVRRV